MASFLQLVEVARAMADKLKINIFAPHETYIFRLSGLRHENGVLLCVHTAFQQSHERCGFCNMECDTKYKRWEQTYSQDV